jgi:hypothetical protein
MPSSTFRFVQKVIEAGGLLPTIRFDYVDVESDELVIRVTNHLSNTKETNAINVTLEQGSLIFSYSGKRIWDTSMIVFNYSHAQSMIIEVAKALKFESEYTGFDVISLTRFMARDRSNLHWIKVDLWLPSHMTDTRPINLKRDAMVLGVPLSLDAFIGTANLMLHNHSDTVSIADLRHQQGHNGFMRYDWSHLPTFGVFEGTPKTINDLFTTDVKAFVNANM